jgi:DNA polymerase III epsilon subunit-like protein
VIVLDLEANGLKPTKIHCVVALDTDEKHMRVFTEPTHLHSFLSGKDVVAHNGISYDFPVLDKLWNIRIPMRNQVDTLVLSRLAKPDRKGGHSLRAWGEHLGFKKGDYQESWDEYTSAMLEYCKRDVLVCERLYNVVTEELHGFSQRSIQDEHMMQRLAHHVEENGFYFDVDTAEELYSKIRAEEIQIVDHLQDVFDPTVVQLKTKTKIIPFNPSSRKQIGDRLMAQGWEPR